jgi:hypothetical protein
MAREDGQGTVEFLAVVPVLLVTGLVVWQLIVVGHAAWMSAHAVRAAARADLVGENAAAAARSVLPDGLERGVELQTTQGRATRLEVPVPIVHRGWHSPVKLVARASLEGVP